MKWRYPRFHIYRRSTGWQIWFIPVCGPIKRVHLADSHAEAIAHIDYLSNKEPTA